MLLSLVEHKATCDVALTADQVTTLQTLIPSVWISPSRTAAGLWDLTPGSTIGVLTIGDLALEIRPKMPIERVLFLIAYAMDRADWHKLPFNFSTADSLVEAIIPGFAALLHAALGRGALRGYQTVEASLQTVRGRCRLDQQITRRFGLLPPVEVRYDEFTEDVEENRILKAALHRLGRLRLRSSRSRQSLAVFAAALEPVSPVEYRPTDLPDIVYTRLNRHYRSAITLAKLILRACSLEAPAGDGARASAFLVDMNQVFEDFVVIALREALGLSERVFPQGATGKSLSLDRRGHIDLEPDLSWWENGRCVFVGDVKYKRVAASGVKHHDLYQLLAYTVAADVPAGLLVYAAGEDGPAVHEVVRLNKLLEVHPLHLDGSPGDILRQVAVLAAAVRRLRGLQVPGRPRAAEENRSGVGALL